jgi:hypothetical protein
MRSRHAAHAGSIGAGRRHLNPLLREAYLLGLQTLWSFGHDKGDLRSLIERAVAARFDRREMHEDVFAVLPCNPNPFPALNHFTVPISFTGSLF